MDPKLQQLLAKDEITDAIHRIARGTDRLDRDLMISGYHHDGFDDHNSFRGSATEFADWVLSVLVHFDATHHFLGQTRIEFDAANADVAHAETYCNAHHISHPDDDGVVTDMAMGLRYIDRFERRDNVWLIARRVCAFDWRYSIRSTEQWAYEDDFTVGIRDRTDISYHGSSS